MNEPKTDRISGRSRRIEGWFAAGLAVSGAAAWFQPPTSGSDLWWHLAAGREIWEQGAARLPDTFTFTFHGSDWLNQYWLWDAAHWLVYQIEPQAVAWLQFCVLLTTAAFLYLLAARESRSPWAAVAAVWLAAATAHGFFDIRPHVYTLLFVVILLATRRARHAAWLWPPLIALWANVHGGFVFGIGVVGLIVSGQLARDSRRAGRLTIPTGASVSLALCLVVWIANPWGSEMLFYPLKYLQSETPFRNLVEWVPPGWSLDPRSFAGRFWWMAGLTAVGLPLALRRCPEIALLAVLTFIMAITSRRFIALFAVSAAPLLALWIAWLQRGITPRLPFLRRPAGVALICGLGLASVIWLWRDVRIQPDLLSRWTISDSFPRLAVRYLEAIGPPARILNDYEWGGYLSLHLPASQIFIDGRANTLFDERIYLDNRRFTRGDLGDESLLERYPADVALLRANSRFAAALTQRSSPWHILYEDGLAVVLVPPGSGLLEADLPTPESVLAGEREIGLREALASWREGDLDTAIQRAEATLEPPSPLIRSYAVLAFFHALRRDAAAIERSVEDGLTRHPRRWAELRAHEARAYELLGDLPRALASWRKAVPTGPFSHPQQTRTLIENLEAQISGEGQGGDPPAGAKRENDRTGHRESIHHHTTRLYSRYGDWATFGSIFVEGMGIPLPGQTLLIGGVLWHVPRGSAWGVIVGAWLASVAGNTLGYGIGALLRRRLSVSGPRISKIAEQVRRRGAAFVLMARFVDGARQLNGIAAGLVALPFGRFAFYNAAGALLWVGVWSGVAWWAADHADGMGELLHAHRLWVYALVLTGLAIAGIALRRRSTSDPSER